MLSHIHLSLFVFFAVYIGASFGWKYEDNVLVMTDNNYVKVKAKFPEMLIEFYAPWCKQCEKMKPEWAKAAKMLENSPIKLAKVDASKHEKLAKHFKVEGFPTVRHLKNSIIGIEYSGGQTASEIVEWTNEHFLRNEGPKLVFEYDEANSQSIFGTGVQKYMFIVTKAGEDTINNEILDACRQVAPFFNGEVKFVHVSSVHRRFLSTFGIFSNPLLEAAIPLLVSGEIVSSNLNGGMKKSYYKVSSNATKIEELTTAFADGGLPRIRLRSEEVQEEDTTGPLTVLRAKSFDKLVVENNRDVLVLFCMPWDKACKTFQPIYASLAQTVASTGNSRHLTVAYLDNEANELDCTCICSGRNYTEAENERVLRAEFGGRYVNSCGFSSEEVTVARTGEVVVREFPTVYLFKGHSMVRQDDDPKNTRLLDAKYVKGRKFKLTVKYELSNETGEKDLMTFLQANTYHPISHSVETDSAAALSSSSSNAEL